MNDIELLQYVHETAEMGIEGLNSLDGQVRDDSLRRVLSQQGAEYRQIADQAERLSLWQAVMALNSDLRAVVTLFYYEDLSIREISAVLGISEAAVKTRLSRGRSRLKQLLHEE